MLNGSNGYSLNSANIPGLEKKVVNSILNYFKTFKKLLAACLEILHSVKTCIYSNKSKILIKSSR